MLCRCQIKKNAKHIPLLKNLYVSMYPKNTEESNIDYDEEVRRIIRERTAEYYGENYEEQP